MAKNSCAPGRRAWECNCDSSYELPPNRTFSSPVAIWTGPLCLGEQFRQFIFASPLTSRPDGQHAVAGFKFDFCPLVEFHLLGYAFGHANAQTIAPFLNGCGHSDFAPMFIH